MPNTLVMGEITQVNSNNGGIKLDVDPDTWHDWSSYADQKGADRPALKKGMKIKAEIDGRGFLRKVTGPAGEALATVGASPAAETNGHVPTNASGRWSAEDSWRATLLSGISSASRIIPRLIGPDGKVGEGEHAQSPSNATYALGLFLAKKAWVEPMPPLPQPTPEAQ